MDKEKIGIDTLLKDADIVCNFTNTIDKAVEDKHVDFFEWFKIIQAATGFIGLVKTRKQAVIEWKDLDEQEKTQMKAHFAEKFDLNNDEAEEMAEAAFNTIVDILTIVRLSAKKPA
ncbi:MAG: hypothetical protein K9H26_10800 [Prolixibacteraceae bacterium]|nr:hypothetical protein [Prolixibacteraceae bacterium]